MVHFTEIQKTNQRLESVIFENQLVENGGYKNVLCVEINQMEQNNIQVDDELNGQIGNFETTFTANNNTIYGVKIDQILFPNGNIGWDEINEETHNFGSEHYVYVTGKGPTVEQ